MIETVPRSLTASEAARYLGVSVTSLRRWDAEGSGPACWTTPGGQRRYKLADLNAWQESRGRKDNL